jgi:hypothetical protein
MYSALITGNIWRNKFLWKPKLPLRIKFSLWHLNKRVTHTKIILLYQTGQGAKAETSGYMMKIFNICFFDCRYARFLWLVIFFTFGIQCPISINDMFSNWLLTLGLEQRKQLLVGTLTLCWVIWTTRNEVIFYKSPIKTYMHILQRCVENEKSNLLV